VIGPGVASECIVTADGLHVNEDHFLVETLDPVTGLPVPDGQPGELTFTTVTKQALPLLRYRTGDIASLRRGTCRCGRTLVKMSKVTGRKDDMLVIRGVNVYPSEVPRPGGPGTRLPAGRRRQGAAAPPDRLLRDRNVVDRLPARRQPDRVRAERGPRPLRHRPAAAAGVGAANRGREGGPGSPLVR
jgi:hypothetical protein